MERLGRALLVGSAVLILAHCKEKASSGGADDAGSAAATATASSPPVPTAPLPPALASLMDFEGEVDMSARSADPRKPAQPVNMLVKGEKVRLDVIPGTDAANTLGGEAFLLLRVADKKVDVVTEARKQVVELDLNNPDILKSLQKTNGTAHPTKQEPPKLTKTGTKETIAGYPCEDWDVTLGKGNQKKISMCVADLTSRFFHVPLAGVPSEYAFALELVDGKHFPFRIIGYDDNTGAESGRIEVTKVDPHPVDATKFEIPAGYKTVDMLQMLQAFSSRAPSAPSAIPGMPPNLTGGPHRQHP
jgi:hypothetical protein